MKDSNFSPINRWINQASLKALDRAYQSAQTIQKIELAYFEGKPIATQPGRANTVTDYFRTQLDRQLLQVRTNLLQFRITEFLAGSSLVDPSPIAASSYASPSNSAKATEILNKLAFIESIVGKYRELHQEWGNFEPIEPTIGAESEKSETSPHDPATQPSEPDRAQSSPSTQPQNAAQSAPQKPRANLKRLPITLRFFGGASQIGKELSQKYEQEMIQELRIRRAQNRSALRWISALLIVPLLTQIAVKQLVLNPVLGGYSDRQPTKVELSEEIQEEFLREFSKYREALEVKALLAKSLAKQEQEHLKTPEQQAEIALAKAIEQSSAAESLQNTLDPQPGSFQSLFLAAETTPEAELELEEEALQEKALELWREARDRQLNGLKNGIADGSGLLVFLGMVYFGRQKLTILQSFTNRAFLNLNDPTKVFLFILITDMFVGFHSAEGWDVILAGILHHFGLPESKAFINGFIATVPVVIDSCIKFWIFSYLTRYSPSASAIYERMNT